MLGIGILDGTNSISHQNLVCLAALQPVVQVAESAKFRAATPKSASTAPSRY